MKLVRLYSNKSDLFEPIRFRDGVSVVVAEIKRKENQGKTVHNIGKSTVARLVDFCLLKGRHESFFLFRHSDRFAGFVFFLEVELDDHSYLTIARSLESRNPVSILHSTEEIPDATLLNVEDWAHTGLGIAPAKRLLDGLFDFSVISPYDYRDLMGYVLREQDDYSDVFHLRKFRGKHREWKPFLAHLLGFDANLTVDLYNEVELEEALDAKIARHRQEAGATKDGDAARIEGILAIRRRELEELTETLDTFDFSRADAEAVQELVTQVEDGIARGNEESYRLSQLLWRLDQSLREESIFFSADQAVKLFSEAGVAFQGQLKRDLDQLIEFNRAISEERRGYLLNERIRVAERLAALGPELEALQTQRAQLVSFLEDSDTIAKYKELSERAIGLRADIVSLSRQRDALSEMVQLRQEKRQAQERKNHLLTAIEIDVQSKINDGASRYREIQRYFDEIVYSVLDEHALLTVSVSSTGALDFSADVVDSAGGRTSAGKGFTFKKLLCIAFDLAVLRSYRAQKFPRFAFHDGVFESLETRAKHRLITVLRAYAGYGLQPVITTLDSDLPEPLDSSVSALLSTDVVCRLSDEGDGGRLFRMASF